MKRLLALPHSNEDTQTLFGVDGFILIIDMDMTKLDEMKGRKLLYHRTDCNESIVKTAADTISHLPFARNTLHSLGKVARQLTAGM